MGLLSSLFQSDEALSDELNELRSTLETYAATFEQKRSTLVADRGYSKTTRLDTYAALFQEQLDALREQLDSEATEEALLDSLQERRLTAGEQDEVQDIKSLLEELQELLQEQKRLVQKARGQIADDKGLAKHDPHQISKGRQELNFRMQQIIDRLKEREKRERELLYYEEREVEELRERIIEQQDFPPVYSVNFPALQTAQRADTYLRTFNNDSLALRHIRKMPRAIAEETGTAYYPASGHDISILFCLPNCSVYVMQDPEDFTDRIAGYLKTLHRTNIIHELERQENEFSFTFNKQRKRLYIYTNKQGRAQDYVPPEVKTGIDVVNTKGYSLPPDVKDTIADIFLEYLTPGAYVPEIFAYQHEEQFQKLTHEWLRFTG